MPVLWFETSVSAATTSDHLQSETKQCLQKFFAIMFFFQKTIFQFFGAKQKLNENYFKTIDILENYFKEEDICVMEKLNRGRINWNNKP